MKTLNDFSKILKTNPNGVLATRAGDAVRARIFQFLFAEGNKAYFCTSSEKPVFAQLKASKDVAFCTYTQDFNPVLTLNGNAVFTEERAVKERVLQENPLIKSVYQSADNPVFKVFYIDVKELETFSLKDGLASYKL